MERKTCFISEADNLGGVGVDSCPKADFPPIDYQWARAFMGEGSELHGETAQTALTVILKLVMRWSDQHHPGCFKYS